MTVQTAYSRVTVVTAERTLDLALPNALPLAEVLPQLMRYAAPSNGDGDGGPVSWALSRVGGIQIPLAQTLADAGVLDGDVLELRPEGDGPRPVMVEDVRDAVEDSVDAAGGVWRTRTSGSFVVLCGSAALAVLGAGAWLADRFTDEGWPSDLLAPGSTVLVLAALLAVTWWAATYARALDAQIAAAVAMLWGALLGVVVGEQLLDGSWSALVLSALGAAAAAGGSRALTSVTTGHVAFGGVVLTAALADVIAGVSDVTEPHAVRVVPVLAVLAVGVVPRVSLSVGGLASADYRVRNAGRLDLAALQARYRTSNAILVGCLMGITVVAVGCGVSLLGGDRWDRTLAVSIAVAMTLRSRVFSRTQHLVALRAGGVLLLGIAATRFALDEPELVPWLAVAAAALTVAGLGLASVQMSDISHARVKRSLNALEVLVIVELLVVLFGALTVYEQFEGIFG